MRRVVPLIVAVLALTVAAPASAKGPTLKSLQAQITVLNKKVKKLQAAQKVELGPGRRDPTLLQAGDLEGAISQFRSAIKLVPSYAPAHLHLAEALHRKGDNTEAEKEFQKATELDPRLKAPTL